MIAFTHRMLHASLVTKAPVTTVHGAIITHGHAVSRAIATATPSTVPADKDPKFVLSWRC